MICPIIGNSKIKQSILNAISEKRLPHALIIEGDIGTGRHTLANYIALATVCENENPPCVSCKNCHAAISANHPDITTVSPQDGKKNIAVSQIRELKNEAYIKPHMSSRRIFIIDKADTLNDQAQNALLKILEEPPYGVSFIIIAETTASFLETIISRCIVFTLSTPESNEARKYLMKKTDFSANDIDEALKSTNNNIGEAIKLLEGENDTKTHSAAKEFFDYMLNDDLWGMLSASSIAEKNRLEADRFFKDLKQHTALKLKENYNNYQAKKLSKLYSKLCELEKNLSSNINLSLLCCLLVSSVAEINK